MPAGTCWNLPLSNQRTWSTTIAVPAKTSARRGRPASLDRRVVRSGSCANWHRHKTARADSRDVRPISAFTRETCLSRAPALERVNTPTAERRVLQLLRDDPEGRRALGRASRRARPRTAPARACRRPHGGVHGAAAAGLRAGGRRVRKTVPAALGILPAVLRLAIAVFDRDDLLGAVGACATHHQRAEPLVLKADAEVHAVGPDVETSGPAPRTTSWPSLRPAPPRLSTPSRPRCARGYGSGPCHRAGDDSSPKSSPGVPRGQGRTPARAPTDFREGPPQPPRKQRRTLERAQRGSRGGSPGLPREHRSAPQRAGSDSRKGCGQLP